MKNPSRRLWKLRKQYKLLSKPFKASLWYTVCNVLNKGFTLLSTPVFTRLMSVEQYGTYTVFHSWKNILYIFTSFNIFLSSYTRGLLLYKTTRKSFTSSQLSLVFLITLFFALLYILYMDIWNNLFQLSPILMLAMFLELFTMPALEFWSAEKRFDYHYKKYVILSLIMNSLSLAGGILGVLYSTYKVEARVFADAFSKAVFGGTLFIWIMLQGRKFYDRDSWKYALRFNIPLLPHYLSHYVLTQADRIMIRWIVGTEQAAYYSVSYTISIAITLIISAIQNSLTPYIYKELDAEQNGNICVITNLLLILIAFLSIFTMLLAPEVILIFAGKQYLDAIYVIPPVAASTFFIFVYGLFSTVEYFYQKTIWIATATSVCAAANLILNDIFIRHYGYCAAGYTTLICYLALAGTHYVFYRKILKEKFPCNKKIYDIMAIMKMSVLVLFVMLSIIHIYRLITVMRYGIILLFIAVIWVKRENMVSASKLYENQTEEKKE